MVVTPNARRRGSVLFAAIAVLALLPASAFGQTTDGRWLVSVGIAPLTYAHENTDIESSPGEESTSWLVGLGGQATVLAGRGVGAWVLALELAVMHSEETTERVDITSSASMLSYDSSSTRVSVGPDVRYLFLEGRVRPFAEIGAGIGLEHNDFPGDDMDLTTLYVHGGPGLQLQLVDVASLDLLLRAEYAASSGEYSPGLVFASGQLVMPTDPLDIDIKVFEVGLHARLSIWL